MSVAGVAHLVERHLAKVEVASSSLVTRSIDLLIFSAGLFLCAEKSSKNILEFFCFPIDK